MLVRRQVVLTGDRINDAQPGFDQRSNEPAVHVNLDGSGARIFKEITRENVGKRMAIVLVEKGKSEVITAPVIREEIGGGRVQISGRMSTREANDIALLMRAGALAAPMEIVEERTVGPILGKENIDKGFNSVAYGLRRAGRVHVHLLPADRPHLVDRAVDQSAAAGGDPVDAAGDADAAGHRRRRADARHGDRRQRADQRAHPRGVALRRDAAGGASPPATSARSATILDSNVTTLIAGIALLIFGSGPVRGFAVVHCLGILTSMFSAVFVSRGIVNLIYGSRKHLSSISLGQAWHPMPAADAK